MSPEEGTRPGPRADLTFRGDGLMVVVGARQDLVPPARREGFVGGVGAVMLVNYTASPVGPYRELLYVGGFFREAGLVRPSVTHILVDSEASRAAGRELYGLPKDLAVFAWHDGHVLVTVGGRHVAEFGWTEHGPVVPFASALVPPVLRTLAQPWQGRMRLTTPSATLTLRLARLRHTLVNPDLFPDVGSTRVLACLRVPRFVMRFPPARVRVR